MRYEYDRPAPRRRRRRRNTARNFALMCGALALSVLLLVGISSGALESARVSAMSWLSAMQTPPPPFEDVFASAAPTDAPPATAIPTLAPAPTPAPTELPGRRLDPDRPAIALTFDDGPSKYTARILDALESVEGRATFFVVGERLDNYSKTLARESDAGHQIGMHSYDHANLTKLSESKIRKQISRTYDLIFDLTGTRSGIVRPPYGSVSARVKQTVEYPLINWSLDTRDWESRDADSVINEILSSVRDGDVILMHDLYSSTAEAVERVLPKLIERGYQLCTVDELFELKGMSLSPGKLYRCARAED